MMPQSEVEVLLARLRDAQEAEMQQRQTEVLNILDRAGRYQKGQNTGPAPWTQKDYNRFFLACLEASRATQQRCEQRSGSPSVVKEELDRLLHYSWLLDTLTTAERERLSVHWTVWQDLNNKIMDSVTVLRKELL